MKRILYAQVITSTAACLLVCDRCFCESCSMSRGQDNVQEDLGSAASLHPGRTTDRFWLNTQKKHNTHNNKYNWSSLCKRANNVHNSVVSTTRRSYANCRVDEEGRLTFGELLHPLNHTVKCERAAWYRPVPMQVNTLSFWRVYTVVG